MNWVATTNDGEIREGTIEFSELDKSSVEAFYMRESLTNNLVPFDCNSGILRFNNLDLTKFEEFTDGEKLLLSFDKERGYFKLTDNSLKSLNRIQKPEEFRYQFGFDKTGNVFIKDNKLTVGLKIGEVIHTFNTRPFDKLVQFRDGYMDVTFADTTPVNKVDRTTSHNIGFETTYELDKTATISVKVKLSYDIVNAVVSLTYIVLSSMDLDCCIHINYGENITNIPVFLTSNSPMETKRVLDLLK